MPSPSLPSAIATRHGSVRRSARSHTLVLPSRRSTSSSPQSAESSTTSGQARASCSASAMGAASGIHATARTGRSRRARSRSRTSAAVALASMRTIAAGRSPSSEARPRRSAQVGLSSATRPRDARPKAGAGEGISLNSRERPVGFIGCGDRHQHNISGRCSGRRASASAGPYSAFPVPERSCDVLVIGSGVAGLTAALSAADAGARVMLATKLGLASSNTAKAQGGIQAALGDDDAPRCTPRTSCTARTRPPTPVSSQRSPPRRPPRSSASSGSASPSRTMPTAATAWRAVAVRRASGCCRWAIAPGHAIATALRGAVSLRRRIEALDHAPLLALDAVPAGWRATLGSATATASRSLPARSCWPPAAAASPRRSGSARSPPTPPARPAR